MDRQYEKEKYIQIKLDMKLTSEIAKEYFNNFKINSYSFLSEAIQSISGGRL